MRPVRVLVVDDSAAMRRLIAHRLSAHEGLEVVGMAADAHEARAAIKALDPEVMTLDVEMPRMDGLDFLERVMRLRPMPVVMVSGLTSRGAETTVRALELGAVDCFAKPTSDDPHAFDDLAEKVRAAAGARLRPHASPAPSPAGPLDFTPDDRVVAIGASTGGVEALLKVLSAFPRQCPPTLVVQHMPAAFTERLAARLDQLCAPDVAEAAPGAALRPGQVLIAPGGGGHLRLAGRRGAWRCAIDPDAPPIGGHRPAVEALFASVADKAGEHSLGVILTGMGDDGARGLLAMRRAGALTLGQDEDTSLIYGMPRAAFEAGAVARQLPLHLIGPAVVRACDLGLRSVA